MRFENDRVVQILVGQFRGQRGVIRGSEVVQDTNVYSVEIITTKTPGSPIYGNTVKLVENQILPLGMLEDMMRAEEKQTVEVKRGPGRPKKESAKQEVVETEKLVKEAKKADKAKVVAEENPKEEIKKIMKSAKPKDEVSVIEKLEDETFFNKYQKIKTLFTFEELQEVARRITVDVDAYLNDLEVLQAKYGFKI